jgi:hypothetical protein
MNVIFSTSTPVPERLTPARGTDREGVTPYVFGVLLLVALVAVPVLSRVFAFVPGL